MVNIKFESIKIDRTENTKNEQITFYSASQNELSEFISENYPEGGVSERGTVVQTKFYQSGPCWCADVECKETYDETGVVVTSPESSAAEPRKHSLRTIAYSVELEELTNYRTAWNHFLWVEIARANIDSAPPVPSYASLKTTAMPFTEVGIRYAWTETPNAPNLKTRNDENIWLMLAGFPTKPGVHNVVAYTWQITEFGLYKSETAAQWVVKNALNTPRSQPIMGSMGVHTPGTWKLDDAAIDPDGDMYRAQLVWTFKPGGYDSDLYPPQLATEV